MVNIYKLRLINIIMKKQVKKYGNTLIISFSSEEQEIYNITEGDIIDVEDIVVIKDGDKKDGDKK